MAQWVDMGALENRNHASLLWFFDSLGAIRHISSLESASSRIVRHRYALSAWFFSYCQVSMSTHCAIRWFRNDLVFEFKWKTVKDLIKFAREMLTFDERLKSFEDNWAFSDSAQCNPTALASAGWFFYPKSRYFFGDFLENTFSIFLKFEKNSKHFSALTIRPTVLPR